MSQRAPLRTITLDGVTYRWRCQWRWLDDRRILHLRVWSTDKSTVPLDVTLESTLPDDSSYIHPGEVHAIIESALAAGWAPAAHGPPFILTPTFAPSLALLTILHPIDPTTA